MESFSDLAKKFHRQPPLGIAHQQAQDAKDEWSPESREAALNARKKQPAGPLTKKQSEHSEAVSERNETRKGKPLSEKEKRQVAITQHPENDSDEDEIPVLESI